MIRKLMNAKTLKEGGGGRGASTNQPGRRVDGSTIPAGESVQWSAGKPKAPSQAICLNVFVNLPHTGPCQLVAPRCQRGIHGLNTCRLFKGTTIYLTGVWYAVTTRSGP